MVQRTLRSLMRFALAVVAVLFCAGLTSSARVLAANADVVAVVAVVSSAAAIDEEAAATSSQSVRTSSSAPVEDLGAADTDLDDDDDDDSLSAVSHLSSLAFRAVPAPGGRSQAIRSEGETDTSRFAAGTGLPRGPPV